MQQFKAKQVLIRYNTESDGKTLCWRLLIDGQEKLVNGIEVEKSCKTSTDWLEDKQCFKHHISVADCSIAIHDETLIAVIS
jgi:hypothetical protein